MTLVAVAWMYVVLLMAVAEAMSPQGSVLGALVTFVLYGVLPLAIVLYIMATPARRRRRRQHAVAEAAASALRAPAAPSDASVLPPDVSVQPPDRGGHAAGDAVAPEGKER